MPRSRYLYRGTAKNPFRKYQERARRAGILREGARRPLYAGLRSHILRFLNRKLAVFGRSKKMRLRTFDDGGDIVKGPRRRYQRSMSVNRFTNGHEYNTFEARLPVANATLVA